MDNEFYEEQKIEQLKRIAECLEGIGKSMCTIEHSIDRIDCSLGSIDSSISEFCDCIEKDKDDRSYLRVEREWID